MPRHTLVKVHKLWSKLAIPHNGPTKWPGMKRKVQCTLASVEKRIEEEAGINDESVLAWAYAIRRHTRKQSVKTCQDWLAQVLRNHTERKTDKRLVISVPLSDNRVLTVGEVLSILLSDQAPDDAGAPPNYTAARGISSMPMPLTQAGAT